MTTALTPEQIKQRLRYMGQQYRAVAFARGGEPDKHYLEQAADCIEALEAELAALRSSTYDKQTIDILVHAITHHDEAADSIEDLKNAADMLKGKSILDVLNAEHDNAAELAACRKDALWNKRIISSVDRLLEIAGYQPDCSIRNSLACMRFDAAIDAAVAAQEKA